MALSPIFETLPSGLTLVAEPWGDARVVSVQVWVGAGASAEQIEEWGAAHLLEHMVFKGAGAWTGTELTTRVEAVGGDLNAWTSVDQTCFHVTVPTAAFELAARTLGAMALVPRLDATDLEPERGVVIEEIREADDDPTSLLGDLMRAAMWGEHAGARAVLGSEASVSGISAEGLRSFHARQYHPSRLAFVVAGPVSEARIRAMALELDGLAQKNSTGESPAAAVPLPGPRPAQPGVVMVQRGHEERVVEVAYPSPPPDHPDVPALDVLTVCLGDGGGARLVQRLRDDLGIAVGAWAAMENEQVGGMTAVGATPREGEECACVKALAESVAQIRGRGPSQGELDRARGLVRSDVLRERETVDGRAHRLGWYWHRFGDLAAEQRYMDAVGRVTAADVQRVANQWLRPERAVIGVATGDAELAAAQVQTAFQAGVQSVPQPSPTPAATLTQRVLPGGLKVSVESRPAAELIGVSIIGVGGSIAEPMRRCGLGSAWARILPRGVGLMGAPELAALVESHSGSLGAWSARNSVGLELSWPADGLAWLGWLLHEVLVQPAFDADELERALDDLRIGRELGLDDPGSLAWEGAMACLYPGHRWGRPVEGTEGGLARVDLASIRRYHQRVTAAANLHVAVSGPVDPEVVFAVLAPVSRALPRGPALRPAPPLQFGAPTIRKRRRTVPRTDAQAQVVLGVAAPTLGVGGADEATVRVVEAVLGGAQGGGGRLFQRIREELGLAYSVGAVWEGGLGGGALLLHGGTAPVQVRELRDALWSCCDALANDGLGVEELERVQQGLVDGAQLGLQRSVSRARHLAAASAYRGDAARWKAALELPRSVSTDAVQALAQRVLAPQRRVVVAAGPRTKAW